MKLSDVVGGWPSPRVPWHPLLQMSRSLPSRQSTACTGASPMPQGRRSMQQVCLTSARLLPTILPRALGKLWQTSQCFRLRLTICRREDSQGAAATHRGELLSAAWLILSLHGGGLCSSRCWPAPARHAVCLKSLKTQAAASCKDPCVAGPAQAQSRDCVACSWRKHACLRSSSRKGGWPPQKTSRWRTVKSEQPPRCRHQHSTLTAALRLLAAADSCCLGHFAWGLSAGGCARACRYLGGVLDFAGELNRFAVARATVRDVAAVQQSRDLVDGLMGQFLQVGCTAWAAGLCPPGYLSFATDIICCLLQFDLRNGSLRWVQRLSCTEA